MYEERKKGKIGKEWEKRGGRRVRRRTNDLVPVSLHFTSHFTQRGPKKRSRGNSKNEFQGGEEAKGKTTGTNIEHTRIFLDKGTNNHTRKLKVSAERLSN